MAIVTAARVSILPVFIGFPQGEAGFKLNEEEGRGQQAPPMR
jgi:hypothetical protein